MKKIALVLVLLSLGSSARAGLLLEPYAGYQFGKYTQTVTGISPSIPGPIVTNLDELSGYGLGARAGLSLLGVMFGGEYMITKLTNSNNRGGIEPREAGAFLGYQFLFGFRVFGTYFFRSKFSNIEGSAYKIGAGFRFHRHVSLNGEYVKRSYDRMTSLPATGKMDGESDATLITLSFPFNLF